jgi:hypothetical protein
LGIVHFSICSPPSGSSGSALGHRGNGLVRIIEREYDRTLQVNASIVSFQSNQTDHGWVDRLGNSDDTRHGLAQSVVMFSRVLLPGGSHSFRVAALLLIWREVFSRVREQLSSSLSEYFARTVILSHVCYWTGRQSRFDVHSILKRCLVAG